MNRVADSTAAQSNNNPKRIDRASMMNVAEFDAEDHRVWTWCFCPEGNLVRGDNMLAQKLALELFETEALAKANRHPPSMLNSF